MTIEMFSNILASWLRTKFLPAIFPKHSFLGFLGGAFSATIADNITRKLMPLIGDGVEIDAAKLKAMAANGFEVSEVIAFDITPELIPQEFRGLIAPYLFDEAHPVIKCEFTKDDVDGLIDLFSGKTIKREINLR